MDCDVKLRRKLYAFEKTVKKYEAKGIETGKILFYGDSDFTCWTAEEGNNELEDDIRMKDGSPAAVNHGLGGATYEELLYYYPRMVRPWKPRALVLTAHGNDYAENYTPEEMMFLLSRLAEYARQDMPGIKIYITGGHPNPKYEINEKYYHCKEFNRRLEAYCVEHEDCTYIDYTKASMFYNDPKDMGDYLNIRKDIFLDDMLHHNKKGYELYAELMREVLDDIL